MNLGVAYIYLDSQLEVDFFYGTKYKLIEIEILVGRRCDEQSLPAGAVLGRVSACSSA